ncbi:MAG: PSD1 and planctomycete cytochrome C domain-containing protein [Fuerstiella sp.]
MFRRFKFTLVLMVISSSGVGAQESTSPEQLQFFETNIRPLLHSRCVKCHGENEQKGGLRLDSRESLLKGGESGPAAVTGKPAVSLLLEAVRYESFEMPPDKPLSEDEIADLETWIRNGGTWPQLDGKSIRLQGAVFTEEERSFWSLQPLMHPDLPPRTGRWGRNEIDRFIAAPLQTAGIEPAPRAGDDVLVRRLYFDLLGVPPSPEDISEFNSAESSERWSKLIDGLLDDSRYGEHWARYWLDVIRYAESDGFRADFYRPEAWRYRDYVVNAFNDDKPYDQFIIEQLAGDEVAPDKAEALVATGYLRTFLYEYNQRDARTQWQDILNQVTDITGEVFLGLGIGCARCHDHKFDPILQADYYRLQACFGTMIPRDDIPAADRADRQQYRQQHGAWLSKAVEHREELKRIHEPYLKKAAKAATEKFPADIQAIMAKRPSDRIPLELQLADLVDRQILFDESKGKISDADTKRIAELEKLILEMAGKEPAKLPAAITVVDLGPRPQVIYLGADPTRRTVVAGGISIIDASPFTLQPSENSTGQRTALATWIASPKNPLTARVVVNRIWQHHFGSGLVETASDFGTLGGRPSHPELLDWLASEFIAHGWSIKWLHRQILNSATWQMSVFHQDAATAQENDPGNRLRWRFDIRRLSAEQIRDAMLTSSGELRSEQGGPSVEHTSLRRSLYLKAIRNAPEPLLRSLDGVDGLNSIPKRSTTTTPTQALNLMNGDWVRKRAAAMARRVLDESDAADPTGIVDAAFRTALGRGVEVREVPVAMQLFNNAFRAADIRAEIAQRFSSLAELTGNAVLVDSDQHAPLATKDSQLIRAAPFTFMGLMKLNSLYPDATVRTIISQWDSNNKNRGWSIGVTSEKSAYQPRNFILQVVGDAGYEVVASNLRPELDKPYLVAVTVEQTDDGKGKATFFLKPLDAKYGKLETAEVVFKSAAGISGEYPVVLGGRHKQSRHKWDGQLDQIALFSTQLKTDAIKLLFADQLRSVAVKQQSPVAAWDFDTHNNSIADSSAHGHDLNLTAVMPVSPLENSVTELCHVLLNSNEFVYID